MCLAHVEPSALDDALAALRPGSDIDLRGTVVTADLLRQLLQALTPGEEGAVPELGAARFNGTQFGRHTNFSRVQFSGYTEFNGAHFGEYTGFAEAQFRSVARFDEAEFSGIANFDETRFSAYTVFDGAQFGGNVDFSEAHFSEGAMFKAAHFSEGAMFRAAQFGGQAVFGAAQFSGQAWFAGVQFDGYAGFAGAQFMGYTRFAGAQFMGYTRFDNARFREGASFDEAKFGRDVRFDEAKFEGVWSGPLVCLGSLTAIRATIERPLRLKIAAVNVNLAGAQFTAPAVLSVRYGAVDLTDVATDAPLTVASHLSPFKDVEGQVMDDSSVSADNDTRAKVSSLAGVDAANVVLSDVDLSGCVFSGAHHLDQIHLEGRCTFAETPRGWQRGRSGIPGRWTRRKVLAEETAWRADAARLTRAGADWTNPGWPVPAPTPAQLAVLYRQLRKALEDRKDTPGAADFYYGEMEARRRDTEGTPRGERALLYAYWLLSGYALRASRALSFLAATAAITFVLLLTVGLPDNQLDPQIAGTVPTPGGHAVLTQSIPDPTLTLPLIHRFTAQRANKAALVVVNSVIFRSTGTNLTGPGIWIEIISRIGEPILLGFAAVAARGRVQR